MENMCKDCKNWSDIGFAGNAGWCEKKDVGTLYDGGCNDDFENLKEKDYEL